MLGFNKRRAGTVLKAKTGQLYICYEANGGHCLRTIHIQNVSNFRSRSQVVLEKEPEPPQAEQPAETKEESEVPLPWQLPLDPDLLNYMREVQERVAPLPSTEDQVTELARCSRSILIVLY